MTERVAELARRLVIGHKRDGRCVYDEEVKRELVELYRQGGVAVAKLARDCGVNANLLTSWIHGRRRGKTTHAPALDAIEVASMAPAFIPVKVEAVAIAEPPVMQVALQARLPNGVVLDLREVDLRHVGEIVNALGRLRCSASTKG